MLELLRRGPCSIGQPQGEDEKDVKDAVREDHQLKEADGIDVEVRGRPAGLHSRTKPRG